MTVGIEGYERHISRFIETSQALDFQIVCRDFVEYLPPEKSHVLDVGAGAGQNAAALDDLGFHVTAIEPMQEFRIAAQNFYKALSVKWLAGSLPHLSILDSADAHKFEFVLIEGVWYHLNDKEREQAAARISSIVKRNGKCAISLRNGPAGMGTRMFPTDPMQTSELFKKYGFDCIFMAKNQDSILPNKENVKWSRIVLQKQ